MLSVLVIDVCRLFVFEMAFLTNNKIVTSNIVYVTDGSDVTFNYEDKVD